MGPTLEHAYRYAGPLGPSQCFGVGWGFGRIVYVIYEVPIES